jgi:hypothetical protein
LRAAGLPPAAAFLAFVFYRSGAGEMNKFQNVAA